VKRISKYSIAFFLIGMTSWAMAQTTVSGTVLDGSNGEPLIGVNVLVKGTVLGTITDVDGKFSLNIKSNPPLTLAISSVGFERKDVEVTNSSTSGLEVMLQEATLLGQEVVVSASRVEESILESPVSIEKMDILDIVNTSADTYYKAIANLKGVDMASSSINFQIVNARGFGSTGNTRFVQLIDGMDTQAPALNFPIGNLNGPSQLDVESVELIPGASSALYGPSAFNGVLLINSKNAFDYQGLSAFFKQGVNHLGKDADHVPAPMYEGSIRYAKSFNDKFAFKINGSYSRAEDWHGTDPFDRNKNPFESIGGINPGSDRLHSHGDEASINLAIFPFSSGFQAAARNARFANGFYASDYTGAGDLPNQLVSITPYTEEELINYGAENIKGNVGLYYRINDRIEASYMYNGGFGTSIYTGAQRYSLSDFGIQQHRVQLRGDNFYARAYGTFETSGGSYITELLAKRVNDIVVGNVNPLFYNNGTGDLTGYLVDYGIEYLRGLADQGYAPGDVNSLSGTELLNVQYAAHQAARTVVDSRYILSDENPTITNLGTGEEMTFEDVKKLALEGTIPDGPSFADRSSMYHAEGQYDFKDDIDWMELQMGASFRTFTLNSKGTIFADTAGSPISIYEYGAYAQAAKRLNDKIKLSGSFRYDKNQNFKGQVNPRISAVYSVADDHNIRVSFQTGFRFPTTQGQYIDLDVLSSRLLGGLPSFYDRYITPNLDRSYTGGSLVQFRDSIFAGADITTAASYLVPYTAEDIKPVKPERVKSFEIGYKSLINNKLLIDAEFYYNIYNDFITQEQVVVATDDGSGNASLPSLLRSDGDPKSTSSTAYSIYTNRTDLVKTEGAAVSIEYSIYKGYTFSTNYSWNKFLSGYDENTLNDFNTPEHKFNVNFGNRKLADNLGFNVTFRWQDEFEWQSSFARGTVPSFNTLDAQVSYKLEGLKSVIKIGGSNLLYKPYIMTLGAPNIGAIYYISLTFDELMN
jgi:iron complex outermembrane receptor protein